MSRGDIHAPEAQALRSFPQPMGAGSSRPLCPLQERAHAARRNRCLGCKGEKPWHLSSATAARTAAPGREADGERRCHTAPQARVEDGAGRIGRKA